MFMKFTTLKKSENILFTQGTDPAAPIVVAVGPAVKQIANKTPEK